MAISALTLMWENDRKVLVHFWPIYQFGNPLRGHIARGLPCDDQACGVGAVVVVAARVAHAFVMIALGWARRVYPGRSCPPVLEATTT